MKSNSKKLVLGKETLKTLTPNQLAAVPSGAPAAGGDEIGVAGGGTIGTTW